MQQELQQLVKDCRTAFLAADTLADMGDGTLVRATKDGLEVWAGSSDDDAYTFEELLCVVHSAEEYWAKQEQEINPV